MAGIGFGQIQHYVRGVFGAGFGEGLGGAADDIQAMFRHGFRDGQRETMAAS
jgi:hypothetical protein